MFALASRYFGLVSETFVTAHAMRLAPGRSAFVTHTEAPIPEFNGPFLCDIGQRPRSYGTDGTPTSARPALPLGRIKPLRDRAVAGFLRQTGTEVMMTEFGGMGVEMAAPAAAAGVKLHVHFHGYDASSHLRFPKIVKAYQTLFAQAEGFITPSRFIADNLVGIGCPADRITVVPCGVEAENFPPSSRSPGLCMAVGRFVEKKAPLTTIGAFAKIAEAHPEARLDYIGDGPLWEEAKAAVAQAGLEDRIRLLGSQPHDVVRKTMGEASFFLQHSVTSSNGDTEGLPVAIMEAMSAGLTIVSTRHSGIPEAVIEGESGALVDEHDLDAMARELDRLLADPDMAAAYGAAARQRLLEKFTLNHAIDKLQHAMGLA